MKKGVLLGLFILSTVLYSQKLSFTETDKQINSYLFSGEWHKSDSLIELELSQNPASLKYNFMKAYTLYYARYFSNDAYDRPTTLQKVKHYTWKAITTGEELEENLPNNFYMGCAYAYLARANAMQQEYWDAYWNAGKSQNYFEDVIDIEPGIHDAYMNLGVFEYYPDVAITGFTSVLAWLGGMSGDRELGLQYIYDTSQKGVLFKDEAIFALGIINSFTENNSTEANHYWTALYNKYPQNNFARTQAQRSQLQMLIDEKGVSFLHEEKDSLASKYSVTNANALNGIGYTLMNQGRMDDALAVFELNIELYPHVANGYDSIAECYMNRGENELAIKFYEKAYEMMPGDTTVTEDFKQRVMEGIEERLEELKSRVNT